MDNLRTNHRGTFVLKDQSFRWLAKLSVDPVPPSSLPQNGSLSVHPAAGRITCSHSPPLQTQIVAVTETSGCGQGRHACIVVALFRVCSWAGSLPGHAQQLEMTLYAHARTVYTLEAGCTGLMVVYGLQSQPGTTWCCRAP